MAEHDRARAPDAETVRGSNDLFPRVGGQLALRQHPSHVVVEDLRGGAGDRAEPARAGLGEELLEGDTELGRAVEDLHRAEGVHVHLGRARLHGVDHVEVERSRQVGVDATLHADLGGALAQASSARSATSSSVSV